MAAHGRIAVPWKEKRFLHFNLGDAGVSISIPLWRNGQRHGRHDQEGY